MKIPLRLSIDEMHCEACVRRVTEALRKTAGVQPDSVDIGSAQMKFDPTVISADSIVAAVNNIGYQARIEK
jgi:copper chaperone CopZ